MYVQGSTWPEHRPLGIGTGCSKDLASWAPVRASSGLARQREHLQAVRELRDCVNAVLQSGLHAGLERARVEAQLEPLTAYDVQVQCCECKHGLNSSPFLKNRLALGF